MPESYQPGQRRQQFGANYQLTESRYAWVITEAGKWMILVSEDKGSGSDVVLFSPRPGRVTDVTINLTNLTAQELDALEELFTTALQWARPVVERRDKEAKDAFDAGDDSFARIYRGLPTVVYRKRPQSEHGEGVRQRPEGVSEGGGGERSGEPGGVRGTGSELAKPDKDDDGPQDDRPTHD